MKLLIDDREPKSIIEKLSKDFDVEVTRLEIGDYVYGDIVIERKEAGDFLNSLFDSRLFSQAKEMKSYEHPFILVHDSIDHALARRGRNAYASYNGSVASLMYDFNLTPSLCANEREFIDRIKFIFNRTNKTETRVHSKRYKKNRTSREIRIDMWQCIPKVGNKKATLLEDKIGLDTLLLFGEGIKDKLLEINGIGEKLADNIMRVIE